MLIRRFPPLLALLIPGLAQTDKVDDYLAKFMADKHVPGLQIGIYQDGKPVKLKGYGATALENGKPVDENTLFNIGSVTKQFTAAAILLLQEQGKLSVEDPLRKHLPELPESFQDIQLKHILGHISGLGDYASVPGFDFHSQYSEKDFVELLAKSTLAGKPGEKYLYSNIGYATLGIVISRASGKPYEDFVTEQIFKKLDMTTTRFIQPGPWPDSAARGYNWTNDKAVKGRTERAKVAAPSGAILTNAVDMAKWDAALRSEALLKLASKNAMWTSAVLSDGKPTNYGFGWSILKNDRGSFVLHTGATVAGFRSAIVRQLDGPYSAVIFANLGAELGLVNVLNEVVKLWKEKVVQNMVSYLQSWSAPQPKPCPLEFQCSYTSTSRKSHPLGR